MTTLYLRGCDSPGAEACPPPPVSAQQGIIHYNSICQCALWTTGHAQNNFKAPSIVCIKAHNSDSNLNSKLWLPSRQACSKPGMLEQACNLSI